MAHEDHRARLIEAAEAVAAFYTAILELADSLVAGLPDGIVRDAVEEEIARIRVHHEQAVLVRSQLRQQQC